jgi:hypothetical protein
MAAPRKSPRPLSASEDRRWWRCACGRTLGEIAGDRVIVRRRDFSGDFPADGARQFCPKCGREHVIVNAVLK